MEHLVNVTRFELLGANALSALDEARDWVSEEDYRQLLLELGLTLEQMNRFIDHGLEYGLLEVFQSEKTVEDGRAAIWTGAQNLPAYNLMLARENQPYLDYNTEEAQEMEEGLMTAYCEEAPPPSIYKQYPGAKTALGESRVLHKVLLNHCQEPVRAQRLDHDWLSDFLRQTFGETGKLTDAIQGEFLLKTYPSGGARHPLECYLACCDVDHVPVGVYHYSVKTHELEEIDSIVSPQDLSRSLFPGRAPAPLTLVLTALPERVFWRYREPTSLGVIMLDLGHALENFALMCRCGQLAYAQNLDLDVEQVAADLGLSAFSEAPLASMAIGMEAS